MDWSPVERIDVATNGLTLFSPTRYGVCRGLRSAATRTAARTGAKWWPTCSGTPSAWTPTFARDTTSLRCAGPGGFELDLDGGPTLSTRAVVAASGGSGHPNRPVLPDLGTFTGALPHVSDFPGSGL
ncbi:hypothetical protein [Streptomyces filamentosus]|uniref:hypothetical protein n=1 Tax=Streptomyces filamentosus TaxID=67294 RepID=UPI0033227C1D